MSDWAALRNKIQQGADWRGTCNVPIVDDTFEVSIRLLTEEERQGLLPKINMKALLDRKDDGQTEAEEVVEDLQSKEDLTDEEEEQLQAAQQDLAAQRADIIEDLGEETFEAIRDAGRIGMVPDSEDVDTVMSETPQESRERFEELDGVPDVPKTRDEAEAALKAEMDHVLDRSPYPVTFTVGQEVFSATQGRGNESNES